MPALWRIVSVASSTTDASRRLYGKTRLEEPTDCRGVCDDAARGGGCPSPAGAAGSAGASGAGAARAGSRAGGGGGRGGPGALFTLADADKDGAVTRAELKGVFDQFRSTLDKRFPAWNQASGALTGQQLAAGFNLVFPSPASSAGGGPQNQTPKPEDLSAMMAALPDKAPATPARARKVLVLGSAQGFVHSSIPLAAKTVEALGNKTKAWATTISYDPADINAENLKQYDAIFLASTTGTFLDDTIDPAATAARKKALLDFVRGGKGLAGIHAASDTYHGDPAATGPGRLRRQTGTRPRDAAALCRRQERGSETEQGRVQRGRGRVLRQGRLRQVRQGGAGGLRDEDGGGLPATAGPGRRRPRTGRSTGQRTALARVQQDDGRLLQVALEQPAAHHREDRRSEEPADRDVPRPALRDQRRDLHLRAGRRSRATTFTSSPASTTRR